MRRTDVPIIEAVRLPNGAGSLGTGAGRETTRMDDAKYQLDHLVLYVDDEPANCLVFEAAYGHEFNIRCAGSGAEALEMLAEEAYSVLVTDYRMPEMNGVQLCERVRREHPQVRRVMATAYSDQRTAVSAINQGGVQHYIEKPLQPDEVCVALRDCIAQVHLERTSEQLRAAIVERERVAALAAARASILHDLGNMSAVVSACAANLRALMNRPGMRVPQEFREEVAELLEAVEYVADLQGQTRRLNVTNGRAPEVLEADDVIGAAVRMLARRPTCTRVVADASDARIYADRIDVGRIVANLIGNAIDAIEGAAIRDGEVRIRATEVGEDTVIEVIDNGPGIAPHDRERVFELHYTTKSASGGSGLGLAICAELAEANGGEIRIGDRRQARGTTLVVTLPARPSSRRREPVSVHA